jgi:hypothetical protein
MHDEAAPACTTFGQFGPATPIAELAGGSDDLDPNLSSDGLELSMTVAGVGTFDIALSTRATTVGAFGPPQVATLSSVNYDTDPSLRPSLRNSPCDRNRAATASLCPKC